MVIDYGGFENKELSGIDASLSFEEKDVRADGVERWSRDEPKETRLPRTI